MEITSLAGGENPGGMADEHPPQDDYDGHAEDGDGGGLAENTHFVRFRIMNRTSTGGQAPQPM